MKSGRYELVIPKKIISKYDETYQGPKYPTKAHGKIPAFNSLEEEANFWDTHEFKSLDPIEFEKPKQETLILRIQTDTKQKLEKVAKKKGVSVSVLSRTWLAEKLRTSI